MSDNPERCANYLRIIRLIVDVGTDTVRNLFYFYKPRDRVAAFFASETISNEVFDLKRRHIITNEQFEKLLRDPNPEVLDISLLITLLINLFKWTIKPPTNGWDKPLSDDDNSLGACLLRLKKLRNSLVGHSADAKLSTEDFESLWCQAVSHLRQIATITNNDKIDEVIESYRSSPLEFDAKNGEKYISLLRQWYEEGVSTLANLQREVEELCKQTTEFGVFFKSDIPERYKRYVLLLYEGGMLVLADILRRELGKEKTDLMSLLLLEEYGSLLSDLPYPRYLIDENGSVSTDLSRWSLKAYTDVILVIFQNKLSRMELKAVTGIKKAYEDFSETALISLDSDKFRPYWTDIVSNINILCAGLDDDTQIACQDLIKKHDTGPVDESAVRVYLLQLRQDCEPAHSLIHRYLDAREKLKHAVEQMQREGACFGHDQVLELKMITHGKTEEKRKLAEDVLYTVFKKAESISDSFGNFEAIKKAVEKILEGIKELPDIKVASVERHCIIMAINCSSCTGLLALLDFVESTPFTDIIQTFSHTLSEHCKDEIIVTAYITIDSIMKSMETLSDPGEEDFLGGVSIKLNCLSIDAAQRLQQIIESSETTNNVNNIAQTLSENLQEKISIETSLDMRGLEGVINERTDSMLCSSAWNPFMSLPERKQKNHQISSPRTERLHKIIADISEGINATSLNMKGVGDKSELNVDIQLEQEDFNDSFTLDLDELDRLNSVGSEVTIEENQDFRIFDNFRYFLENPSTSGPARKRRLSSLDLNFEEYAGEWKRTKKGLSLDQAQNTLKRSLSLPDLPIIKNEDIDLQLSGLRRKRNRSLSCELLGRDQDDRAILNSTNVSFEDKQDLVPFSPELDSIQYDRMWEDIKEFLADTETVPGSTWSQYPEVQGTSIMKFREPVSGSAGTSTEVVPGCSTGSVMLPGLKRYSSSDSCASITSFDSNVSNISTRSIY